MFEVIREVGRDAFPTFVRRLWRDGRDRFVEGWRGRNRPHHRCRAGIAFDDHFVANAHMIQKSTVITCPFRGRNVDHAVSHPELYTHWPLPFSSNLGMGTPIS